MAAAASLEVACVGCSRSQNMYSCRLSHSVALGVHPDSPLNRPDPQHAFVTSLNPARVHVSFKFHVKPGHPADTTILSSLNRIDQLAVQGKHVRTYPAFEGAS